MEYKIHLPSYVHLALDRLTGKGFSAYAVGGCVRDSLLGKKPGDWDLTTSSLPEDTLAAFPEFPTILTGVAHGTVTVVLKGQPVEITTFRQDGIYSDHRRPDSVQFSGELREDLRRRDFTVNAMAYNEAEGLIDLFGGREDLKQKLLRTVGDPRERFREDSLRILRGLRFSAVLGFRIEEETRLAMKALCQTISFTAPERQCTELKKLLTGQAAAATILENSEVLCAVIPELGPMIDCAQENPHHCFDVFRHTAKALEAAEPVLNIRLAVLLHDIGKPACKTVGPDGVAHFFGHARKSCEIAEAVLSRLRFEKKTSGRVLELIRRHDEPMPFSGKRIKRLLASLGREGFLELLALKKADLLGQNPTLWKSRLPYFDEALQELWEIEAEAQCFTLKQLEIDGRDLLALGYPAGRILGKALDALLNAVIDGTLENQRETLLQQAKEQLLKLPPV